MVSSSVFDPLRSLPQEERAVLAGIDSKELDEYAKTHAGSSDELIDIKVLEILSAVLDVAAGKRPPDLPGYNYDDSLKMLVVVLPKMDPIDYKALRSRSIAEAAALHSA